MGKYLRKINMKDRIVKTAMATFKDGWIGRMTDYESASADFKSAQLIQHSASLSGGTSGSPMFTSDGKVVALNNAGTEFLVHTPSGTGLAVAIQSVTSAAKIAYAIRVDVLVAFKKKLKW